MVLCDVAAPICIFLGLKCLGLSGNQIHRPAFVIIVQLLKHQLNEYVKNVAEPKQ